MFNVYSKLKEVKSQKPFDLVFNKKYISNLNKNDSIEYWSSNYDFLRGREYYKDYPKEDLFSFNSYSSVAVVGNSGSLINSKFGREIDDHECVIRFNTAPTDEYIEDVGSSVDFRVSIGTLSYRSDNENILRTYRREVQPRKELKRDVFEEDYHYLLTDKFISWVQGLKEEDTRSVCSSGFLGVFFALFISSNVSLYGFNLPTNNDHDYHYHSRVQYSENSHNFQLEHEIYSSLEKKMDSFRWIKN